MFDKNTQLEDAMHNQNINMQNTVNENGIKNIQITSLQKRLSGRINQIKDLSQNEIVLKKML